MSLIPCRSPWANSSSNIAGHVPSSCHLKSKIHGNSCQQAQLNFGDFLLFSFQLTFFQSSLILFTFFLTPKSAQKSDQNHKNNGSIYCFQALPFRAHRGPAAARPHRPAFGGRQPAAPRGAGGEGLRVRGDGAGTLCGLHLQRDPGALEMRS